MVSGSEQSEKHQGGRPVENRIIDKDAVDVAAQLTAEPDIIVDPQVYLRLR
jgi:hypothetical protein